MTDKEVGDIYAVVKALEVKVDQMNEIRAIEGGDTEILARIQEHEQLMLTIPRMEVAIDVLADAVIGEKISDPLHPNEFQINGKGQPVRDTSTGLLSQRARLHWRQVLLVTLGQAAAIAVFIRAFMGASP